MDLEPELEGVIDALGRERDDRKRADRARLVAGGEDIDDRQGHAPGLAVAQVAVQRHSCGTRRRPRRRNRACAHRAPVARARRRRSSA